MQVLDKGELTLVDFMGNDLSVVQGARISNGAALPDWRGAPDERLIGFLAENGHMSPFEHAVAKFYVKAPIFVAREWQRHRTFSYNERSGRYKRFDPEFYTPQTWRKQDPENKQSSIDYGEDYYADGLYQVACLRAFKQYERLLNAGVAREMARMVLPVSTYTEFYVTGNFRNFMHFLELRNTPEAQWEIRVYAQAIAEILQEKMPLSFGALTRTV